MGKANGERIRFFRKRSGMSQKGLGIAAGLNPASADVRIAQYESGNRRPKPALVSVLARALGVSAEALTVPEIRSSTELMQLLFYLEDVYGLTVADKDDEVCICFGAGAVSEPVREWLRMAERLRSGEITQDEYDHWRYTLAA